MRVPDESRAPRIASGRTPAILRDVVTGPRPLDWTTADSGDGSLASTERITIPGIMYCYLSDHIVESILFEYLLVHLDKPMWSAPQHRIQPFLFSPTPQDRAKAQGSFRQMQTPLAGVNSKVSVPKNTIPWIEPGRPEPHATASSKGGRVREM